MSKLFVHFWQNFKEYFVFVSLIVLSLYLITLDSSPKIQKLRAVIFGSYASLSSIFTELFDFRNLKSENDNLRKTNAELMLQLSKLRQDILLITELKNSLALKDTFKYSLISSRIVSRQVNNHQESFILDCGKKDGVEIGMPVISDKGLVGIVFSVSNNFSLIRTLRNSDLSLTIKSERTGEQGILKWKENNLRIINVPKTYQIKKGDRIVVSEISSIVPIVFPVGVAYSIENIEKGIFNEIIVHPFIDFDKLKYVFVVPVVASKEIKDLELNFLKNLR
jgi:rod shape-determining protein MreC